MKLSPRFDQSLLTLGKRTCDELYRCNRKHADMLLIIGMKMGCVMSLGQLDEHTNNDAEKSRKLWHVFASLLGIIVHIKSWTEGSEGLDSRGGSAISARRKKLARLQTLATALNYSLKPRP